MARASPLPAQARRDLIIAATERLIVAQGGTVSTRAIAEAAGIAEGTIFRVFPTKDAIIDAIFEEAYSQDRYKAELAAIDRRADLETRMIEIVRIVQRRVRRHIALFSAVGFRRLPSLGSPESEAGRKLSLAETAAILEPDRDRLACPPLEAARFLQSIVIALSLPMLSSHADTPDGIVRLVLCGIGRHPAPQQASESSAC